MTAQQAGAGAGGIIRAPRAPGSGFDIVPHARSRDTRLSFRARAILERLLSNADGFSMTAIDVARESPSEGRGAILLALRELRQVGYLVTERSQGSDGRWRTKNVIYDTPQGEAKSAEVALPDLGLPDSGPPASGKATLRAEVPLRNTKKQKHAGGGAAAPEKFQGEQPAQTGRRGELVVGVECWTDCDRKAVTQLIEAHDEAAVLEAAQKLRQAGQRALPTAVTKVLQPPPPRTTAADTGALAEIKAREAARAAGGPTSEVAREELAKLARKFRLPMPNAPASGTAD